MYLTIVFPPGSTIQPSLPFYCKSVFVDNPGWQWVHFPSLSAWIAPFTRGAVVSLFPTTTPLVDSIPPIGFVPPLGNGPSNPNLFTQIGDSAQLRFSSVEHESVAGYSVQPPVGIKIQSTTTHLFQGIPLTDPYYVAADISPSYGLQTTFGSNFPIDILNVVATFQSVIVPASVITINLQVGFRSSIAGGSGPITGPTLSLPTNGILNASFQPGQWRETVNQGLNPHLIPFIAVGSDAAGSLSLTQGSQAVRASITWGIGLY